MNLRLNYNTIIEWRASQRKYLKNHILQNHFNIGRLSMKKLVHWEIVNEVFCQKINKDVNPWIRDKGTFR